MDLTMMERVGDREGKMEGYCSTGQSPQRAVVPEEEEDIQTHDNPPTCFGPFSAILREDEQYLNIIIIIIIDSPPPRGFPTNAETGRRVTTRSLSLYHPPESIYKLCVAPWGGPMWHTLRTPTLQ
jgi:hypothetical protein